MTRVVLPLIAGVLLVTYGFTHADGYAALGGYLALALGVCGILD